MTSIIIDHGGRVIAQTQQRQPRRGGGGPSCPLFPPVRVPSWIDLPVSSSPLLSLPHLVRPTGSLKR